MQRYTAYLHLETALHVSGGTSTNHQERKQLYLQHLVFVLWVAYATHSTLKPVPTLPR
jgi:tryptophan 2,3-dioxygenase